MSYYTNASDTSDPISVTVNIIHQNRAPAIQVVYDRVPVLDEYGNPSFDTQWEKFGVWEDKNADGITDIGEFNGVGELGIASIDLTSNGEFSIVNGNIIHGITQVAMNDGGAIGAADVTFQVSQEVFLI